MAVVVGVFRASLAAITAIALFWAPSSGPYFHVTDFVYFTDQSNLALVAVMAWGAYAVLAGRAGPPPWLWAAVTLYLLITALVSQLILDPPAPGAEIVVLGLTKSGVLHHLTPIATLVHFLVMLPHRRLRLRHALYWLAYPVAYVSFVVVRGLLAPGSEYPYGFVDVDEHGYGGLALNIVIYGVGFWVLGLVLVGLDRVLPARALVGPRDDPAGPRPDYAGPTNVPADVGNSSTAGSPREPAGPARG